MQAIQVKYLAATNTKGTRLKAFCMQDHITINYCHSLNKQQNAIVAVTGLLQKLEWEGNWVGGEINNGSYVFVRIALAADREVTMS